MALGKSNGKTSVAIVYNDIANPFVEVIVFKDNVFDSASYLDLDSSQIENGMPQNESFFAENLKDMLPKGTKEVSLLINCSSDFSTINTYSSSVFRGRIRKFVETELKEHFSAARNKYLIYTEEFKNSVEYIVYTNFVSGHIRTFFMKVAKMLGIRVNKVDSYPRFIKNCVAKEFNGEDFVYVYFNHSIATIICSYSNNLSGYETITNDPELLDNAIFLLEGKHVYELEKIKVSAPYTNIINLDGVILDMEDKPITLDITKVTPLR